jgi:transcriptional regulator with XRE-family HTH domain
MADELSSAETLVLRVGLRMRERREAQGLSLRALAARSRVSPSTISDIERGAKSPTISTLALLADALGASIADLLEDARPAARRFFVTRAADRRIAVDRSSGAKREGFGPAPSGSRVEFLRYTVPPRAVAGPFPAHSSGTIEHVHVVSGAVRIVFGNDAVRLRAGDSCSCVADAPHSFDNMDGKKEALLYLVIETG